MRAKLSFSAAGDFLPQRRIPEQYDGFKEVADFIKRADARFFNLETTFPDETCFGQQFYGGASAYRGTIRTLEAQDELLYPDGTYVG